MCHRLALLCIFMQPNTWLLGAHFQCNNIAHLACCCSSLCDSSCKDPRCTKRNSCSWRAVAFLHLSSADFYFYIFETQTSYKDKDGYGYQFQVSQCGENSCSTGPLLGCKSFFCPPTQPLYVVQALRDTLYNLRYKKDDYGFTFGTDTEKHQV